MTASNYIKGLLAGVATVALIGTAVAQGNPPNPAKSAPVGAGQQSSQQTPMGTTGTPTGGSTAAGSGSTSGSANMGAASTSGTSSGSTSMGSGNTSANAPMSGGTTRPVRTARADRN